MKNKKLVILALSALGVLGLTACSEVVAKATDYSSQIITVEGYDQKIYNNEMSVVYDSIRSGNIGSDVLNELYIPIPSLLSVITTKAFLQPQLKAPSH